MQEINPNPKWWLASTLYDVVGAKSYFFPTSEKREAKGKNDSN